MPTTKYTHKPDDYMGLTFRLTYSLDDRGNFGAIDRIMLEHATLRGGDATCIVLHWRLGVAFIDWWESHVEGMYDSEIAECIQEDIEAAREADADRRRKERDE